MRVVFTRAEAGALYKTVETGTTAHVDLQARRRAIRQNIARTMDEETKARFDEVAAALGTINRMLGEIIELTASKAQLDAMMKRMNDGFQRVLLSQHVLQVNDDTLTQRVTRLEEDVRHLRGGGA